MKVKVQKRDGRIVEYNADKITAAIKKANVEVDNSQKVSDDLIEEAIGNVEKTDKEEMGNLSLPFENIRSKLQIDNLIKQLTSTISQKLKTSSSTFTAQDRKNDLATFIQKQIKKKRTLRAVWQRTRDPIVKSPQ